MSEGAKDTDGDELGGWLELGDSLGCVESDGICDVDGAIDGMMVSITLYSITLSFMLKLVPPGPSSMYTPDSVVPIPNGQSLLMPKNLTPSMS